MPQIRPITDLRNTNEISELCHAKKEPLFITKNGYGDLVVMSIEAYEELIETVKTDAAISEAEMELEKDGVLLDARESLTALRRKHFG
ncbi:MAG: type II toxin-antitoxin system Phd/YefM family antitoxin [Clostridia bacterium]|nr:type II toxin-antitoxin system Phd/YefM family antitoxin [Clostridia bacterium]